MLEHPIDYDILIAKYLDNEIAHDEKTQLSSWVKLSNAHEAHFVHTAKAWENSLIEMQDKTLVQQRFQQFFNQIQREKKHTLYTWALSGAAAVVLLFIGLQLWQPHFLFGEKMLKVVAENAKKQVILPDSSIVWLNAGSSLTYPSKFKKNRNVYLIGEGYFDVKKEKKHVFSVQTDHVTIDVLGTKFLITDRHDRNLTETVLESGKVNLTIHPSGKKIAMKPNQRVMYDKMTGTTDLQIVNASNYTQWRQQNIVFENTPLSDVFIQLEKWYNIEIACNNNSLLNIPVSLTIDEEPLKDVLNILQQITSLGWTKKENQITIQ